MIEPLSAGRIARYQRYDWATGALAEWHELEPASVVIIEGVTAARREWRSSLAFILWIETPRAERLRRGLECDGPEALGDWGRWGAAEDSHFEMDPTRQHADIVVDGTAPIGDEEFTTLQRTA